MSDFDKTWYIDHEEAGTRAVEQWLLLEPTGPFKDFDKAPHGVRVRTARCVASVYRLEDAQCIVDAVNKAKGEG